MSHTRAGIVRDPKVRRAWLAQLANCRCWRCGCGNAWPGLNVDHIIGASGRSDEPENFALLCHADHSAKHGVVVVRNGVKTPPLTLANVLWLKMTHDPDNYRPERLAQLRGQALPEPVEPQTRRLK